MTTNKVFLSRDVQFYETLFPFMQQSFPTLSTPFPTAAHSTPCSFFDDFPLTSSRGALHNSAGDTLIAETNDSITVPANHVHGASFANSADSEPVELVMQSDQTSSASPVPVRRSDRIRSLPKHLQDFECKGLPQLHSATRSPHALSKVFSYSKLSLSHYAFSVALDQMKEPISYAEAIKHQCWRDAIQAEIDALEANETWEVVDLPPRKVPIDCKIVYRIKYKVNGEVERYKGRIVAKGFTQ